MPAPRLLTGVIVVLLFSAWGIHPAGAELPPLDKPPWLGYFAVLANRHYHFGLTNRGKITLAPLSDNGKALAKTMEIPVEILVEEILPNGKTSAKQLKPESLTSEQPATDKLEKVVIRGKVTGDASFEVTLEHLRDTISLGGRLLSPGPLSKNPLRFSLRVKFPSAYPKEMLTDKKDSKLFAKKIAADHLTLTWTDGKRKKQTFDQTLDASLKDLNGPGIASAEIVTSAYKGSKILVSAAPNSVLALSHPKTAPLHEGFALHWLPDAAKDPDGKARLSLQVR